MGSLTDLCLLEPLSLEGLVWCRVPTLLGDSVPSRLLGLACVEQSQLTPAIPASFWFASPFILSVRVWMS